jgi:hypothetical protein
MWQNAQDDRAIAVAIIVSMSVKPPGRVTDRVGAFARTRLTWLRPHSRNSRANAVATIRPKPRSARERVRARQVAQKIWCLRN